MAHSPSSDTTTGLPPELWLKILSEHELSYLDLKRLAGVNREFNDLVKNGTFDSLLFRSPLSAASIAQGTEINLHPMLFEAQLVISKPEEAIIFGGYNSEGDVTTYHLMDYLARQENATSPPLAKFWLAEIGPPGKGGWVRSSREGGAVSVEDVVRRIAELWMVMMVPASGKGKPTPFLKLLKQNSDHQFWEGWDPWEQPFKMGKSAFVLRARGLGS